MGKISYKYQLESIEKLAKIGFWELNLKSNELIWSKEIYNIFGLDKNIKPSYELFLDLVYKDDRELVNSAYLKSLEDRKDYSIVHRVELSNKEIKYVKEDCKTIFDENKKALISHGTVQDITELTVAKQKIEQERFFLKEQQELLETIFNNTIDGLAIIDKDTNFIKVNKTYCELTGYTQEELLQTSCIALTAPEDIQRVKALNEEFIKGDIQNITIDKSCIGKYRKIDSRIFSSWLPNKEHILINMKDLTSDNILKEQAKLFSMKGMLENIAHQWRQPLSIISSIASGINILKKYDKLNSYDFEKDMNLILQQVNYLSNTIEDISNFVVDDKSLESTSLVSILEKSLNIFNPIAKLNSINIVVDFNEDLVLKAYSNELIQSFINILTNSKDALIKQTEDRYIFVSTKSDKDLFIIEIKDSGKGVDKAIINRVFEPYFTTKHQSLGTGIGLSMTHNCINIRHNATIEVANSEYIYNNKKYRGLSTKIYFKK